MACGFLLDMDGVIHRGGELLPGAQCFVHELLQREIPFSFLTNNSQRTRRDRVIESLAEAAEDPVGLLAPSASELYEGVPAPDDLAEP
jgi:ribonucleotide monophosphatase NagD (HAD superfamily)